MLNDEQTTPESAEASEPKAKKKKSKGLREPQRLERAASKSVRRVARAVLSGMDEWNERREKSAKKKKDGAIVDAFENAAHAVGKLIQGSAKAGPEMVSALKPRISKKSEKRITRALSSLL